MTMLTVATLPTVFDDIKPLAQDDGPHPVCVIDYKPDFEIAHDYLRAVLKKNEKSERALALTGMCLAFNPANYTVWHYRREILKELGFEVQAELEWSAGLGGSNPKNYQLWHHRRALLEHVGSFDVAKELEYVAVVLKDDGKNYHAWSHRQWILQNGNSDCWENELTFLETLITEDGRNNSAWNQRWFVSHCGLREKLSKDQATVEAAYAIRQCKIDPYNESPWRYLIGVLKEAPDLVEECQAKAVELKSVLIGAGKDPDGCVSLNSANIDMLEMMKTKNSLENAIELAKTMAATHDTIRAKYWDLRVRELKAKMEG